MRWRVLYSYIIGKILDVFFYYYIPLSLSLNYFIC
nr:MAG TPA: hypothetical protein [Caudoviricetes sp.]DAR94865.1 MAG TPA: hypothetical protein [Caudoviricetes sp.]DAW05942.1 MAG TPA: hypothetical protein [Caudoviricetes sp.]